MAITTHKRPGRTRERLAEMLRAEGFDLDAEDIRSTNPIYVSAKMGGCCSWEADCKKYDQKHDCWTQCNIMSWNTMTECVRKGFTCVPDERYAWHFTLYAKDS